MRRIPRPWALSGANGIKPEDRIDTSSRGGSGSGRGATGVAPRSGGAQQLPPPVVAFVPPGAGNKVRLHWEKLKRRVGNGSAPSDSLGDPTATTESDNGSTWRGAGGRQASLAALDEVTGEKKEEFVDEVVVDQESDFECW